MSTPNPMYLPEQFREERAEVLHEFIARHPFGTLVAMSPEGLTGNHLPLLWSPREGTAGVLRGHLARANPLWKLLPADTPVLAMFMGAHQYITPSWYPAKKENGKVVPTWNYSVVHAHGTIRFSEDPAQALSIVRDLTDHQEATRAPRWRVSDAPADYIDALLKSIVPFEIALTRLTAKFKASQHRPPEERVAVAAALEEEGVSAEDRAEVVRERSPR
jgi:transcriptional regulator